MNFRLKIENDSAAILTTGAAVDIAGNIFPTLRAARNALTDLVDGRIRTLRRVRDEVIRTPERELASDEPPFTTIGDAMAEIGRQVEAGTKGTPDDPVYGKPHGHGVDANADDEAA